jgi:PPOX class probable F420-dependent enzyme
VEGMTTQSWPLRWTEPARSLAFRWLALEELPPWAVELLEAERVARLAFLDEQDRPRVLPVTYAVREGAVWSAIDDKPKRAAEPARVRRLRRRPEAALCVDRYSDDWSELAWVQLLGRIDVLPLRESPGALAALAARYPVYAERTPPGPLLRLSVERALSWRATG